MATMPVAEETLRDLEKALAGRAVPRVRALHLPDSGADGSKDGEFGALELEDGSLGLSYLLLDGTLAALRRGAASVAPVPADAWALATQWLGSDPVQRAVGFAAVNALTRHVFDRAGFVPPPATDSLAGLAPQPGEHLGMVGLFPPLVPHVLRSGARLTVLELRPELAGARDGYAVTLDRAALAGCDKLLITSTTLLNGSLDGLLSAAPRARAMALIGPGAGCLPGALFRHGITTVAGSWITDGPGLCRALHAGTSWSDCARKFCLPADVYAAAGIA